MEALLLAMLAGAGVVLVFAGLAIGETPDSVAVRLQQFTNQAPSLREVELAAAPRDRMLKPAIARISSLLANLQNRASLERLEKLLLMAGSPRDMKVEDLLGWKGLAALACAFVGFMLGLVMHGSVLRILLFIGIGAVIGYMLPTLLLKRKIKARQKAITKLLPDAIDMLSISVEAGLAFDSAMGRLSSKMHNELTMEFDRVSAEIRMGKRRRDAMRNLIERTGVDDLSAFVNAIIQADTLGAGISNVLKTQAQTMRVKRRQRAEERARKAPVKMMFPLVGLLFPPLLIVILGPALPTLFNGIAPHH
ncbi:MAG TPA: type II secretion system F family protein [Chloroflexota bacterium]|nr:type II secretion system F family protein [Chloroflexota bacterium]